MRVALMTNWKFVAVVMLAFIVLAFVVLVVIMLALFVVVVITVIVGVVVGSGHDSHGHGEGLHVFCFELEDVLTFFEVVHGHRGPCRTGAVGG